MRVGWYVHHHGSGHLQRLLAVRGRLSQITALSSLPRPPEVHPADWVELPLDAPAAPAADPQAAGALHWAPLGHGGLRTRMAIVSDWIARTRPHVFVCDVSVEVALLARLCGVPVVWIAQRGRRTDAPHRLAYQVSTVVAPWTRAVDSTGGGLPDDVVHIGALSRFDSRRPTPRAQRRRVTVVLGRGGHAVTGDQIAAAARATPDWRWTVAGLGAAPPAPACGAGEVTDTWPLLCDADVVVGAPGGGLVAEVAAARRALVCIPQERPFDEQLDAGRALTRAGLAESSAGWPAADRWPEILRRAGDRDPARWSILHDGRAGDRLAEVVRSRALTSAG